MIRFRHATTFNLIADLAVCSDSGSEDRARSRAAWNNGSISVDAVEIDENHAGTGPWSFDIRSAKSFYASTGCADDR